jgi:hypothetical protein
MKNVGMKADVAGLKARSTRSGRWAGYGPSLDAARKSA